MAHTKTKRRVSFAPIDEDLIFNFRESGPRFPASARSALERARFLLTFPLPSRSRLARANVMRTPGSTRSSTAGSQRPTSTTPPPFGRTTPSDQLQQAMNRLKIARSYGLRASQRNRARKEKKSEKHNSHRRAVSATGLYGEPAADSGPYDKSRRDRRGRPVPGTSPNTDCTSQSSSYLEGPSESDTRLQSWVRSSAALCPLDFVNDDNTLGGDPEEGSPCSGQDPVMPHFLSSTGTLKDIETRPARPELVDRGVQTDVDTKVPTQSVRTDWTQSENAWKPKGKERAVGVVGDEPKPWQRTTKEGPGYHGSYLKIGKGESLDEEFPNPEELELQRRVEELRRTVAAMRSEARMLELQKEERALLREKSALSKHLKHLRQVLESPDFETSSLSEGESAGPHKASMETVELPVDCKIDPKTSETVHDQQIDIPESEEGSEYKEPDSEYGDDGGNALFEAQADKCKTVEALLEVDSEGSGLGLGLDTVKVANNAGVCDSNLNLNTSEGGELDAAGAGVALHREDETVKDPSGSLDRQECGGGLSQQSSTDSSGSSALERSRAMDSAEVSNPPGDQSTEDNTKVREGDGDDDDDDNYSDEAQKCGGVDVSDSMRVDGIANVELCVDSMVGDAESFTEKAQIQNKTGPQSDDEVTSSVQVNNEGAFEMQCEIVPDDGDLDMELTVQKYDKDDDEDNDHDKESDMSDETREAFGIDGSPEMASPEQQTPFHESSRSSSFDGVEVLPPWEGPSMDDVDEMGDMGSMSLEERSMAMMMQMHEDQLREQCGCGSGSGPCGEMMDYEMGPMLSGMALGDDVELEGMGDSEGRDDDGFMDLEHEICEDDEEYVEKFDPLNLPTPRDWLIDDEIPDGPVEEVDETPEDDHSYNKLEPIAVSIADSEPSTSDQLSRTDAEYVGSLVDDVMERFLGNFPEYSTPSRNPIPCKVFVELQIERAPNKDQSIFDRCVFEAVNEGVMDVYRRCNRLEDPSHASESEPALPFPSKLDWMADVKRKVLRASQHASLCNGSVAKSVLEQDAWIMHRNMTDLREELEEVRNELN